MERLPYYQVLHLLSLAVLSAHTFMAFANPAPENRKRTMILTGIAALLMVASGFAMLSINKIPFSAGWVWGKLVCLLGLSAMAGIAYRRPHLRSGLSRITLALVATALVMVYFRPF
jgi:uncharacterized membrane protein SirB2